jgi:acyl-CoA thioesterase-1
MDGCVLPIRYLALGDSYTICTGASLPAGSWPALIAGRLEQAAGRTVEVTNLGVNGYTTSDLIAHQLPHLGDAAWDCISVLIGVNDLYQGYGEPHYHSRLVQIYDAIAAVGCARVLAVSIPDYSYTPVGMSSRDPELTRRGLRVFNASAKVTAELRGFVWVDIAAVSRARIGTPGWIADDGLHPGDMQYEVWADHIWPVIRRSWTALGS